MGLTDRPGETPLFSGHPHQMDVMVHEAVGPDLEPVTRCLYTQEGQIALPVFISEAHGLAAIAALRHVVGDIWNGQTRSTSHGRILCPASPSFNQPGNGIGSPEFR